MNSRTFSWRAVSPDASGGPSGMACTPAVGDAFALLVVLLVVLLFVLLFVLLIVLIVVPTVPLVLPLVPPARLPATSPPLLSRPSARPGITCRP